MLKNKIKQIKNKIAFSAEPENEQKTIIKGLVFILGLSILTHLIILNTGIFTPGYSQPFMDWLHTSGGTAFMVGYIVLLTILVLLSVNKTKKLITKGVKKITSPLPSRFASNYSTDSMANRKKRIKYLVWVIVVLTPLVVFTFINQEYAQAGWWNDNWSYRQRVTISNSGSQQTDFQVLINLNTSSLVSAGKMRSDCADIRLMDQATNNPITDPYYVEDCNTSSTNIWVKMASVPTTDTIYYLYYGNNTASSIASNSDDIFIAYDNFNDGSIDSRWTQHGDTGPWSETGGYLRVTDTDNDAYSYMYFNKESKSNTDDFVVESRMRFNSSSIWGSIMLFDNGTSFHHVDFNPNRYSDRATSTAIESPEVPTINNDGTWYSAKLTYDGGTGTLTIYHNGTNAYVDANTGSEGSSSGYFGVGSNYAFGYTDWDYYRVRKYASTEPSSALASQEVGPQPMAYWKFDEGYGQTAYDSTTSQIDAQLGSTSGSESSDPSWQIDEDCFSGKCLYFDGSDDYVDTGYDFSWSDSESFSMSAWVNIPSSGNHVIIGKDYTTDYEYRFSIGGLTPYFIYWDTGGSGDLSITSSQALSTNTWHHIVVTYNGTAGYLYVDGEQTGSDLSTTGPFQNRSVNTKIGEGCWNSGVGDRFTGKIDEVKIYPYARSADEILTDFINGAGVHGSSTVLGRTDDSKLREGLVAYWKMDETSANTCDDTNDACDSSGNLNHARWEDNATTTGGKFAGAVDFDGTNDRVATSSSNGIPGGSGTAADWFHLNWNARRKVTFDNSDSTENLDDFPVLIKLNSTRVDYNKTQNSGQDIRFTDSDGTTQLAHEIEKWDEAGTSWVWVKVPNIPSTSTTDYIWMYYDNENIADGQDATNVWDDNYVMVQHTQETSGTTIYDSTSWGSNGTKKAATEPNPNSSGKVDGTQYFDGSNDYVDVGHPDQLDFTTGMTASAWIYPQDTSSQWDRVFHKPWTSDASPWNVWAMHRTASAQTYTFTVTVSGPAGRSAATSSSAPLNNWTYLTGTYNGQVAKMYFNGNQEGSNDYGSQSSILTNALPIQLGRNYYNREYVMGRYDEYRLSNIARSGEWVEAEYETMQDTFVSSYSPEERQSNPISMAVWVKADTLGATDRVIIARNNSGSYSWAIHNDSSNPGNLAFTSDGEANTGVSNTTLSTGIWYHVAMTVDKDKTRLYVNGSLDKEITHNGILPGTGDISVGADPDGTGGWDGKIDEVRMYDRTLPANEVTQLYKWAPSPIAYYPLDEGTGTTNVYDRSGNEYHGTMNGSMTEDDWVDGKIGKALDFDGNDDFIDLTANLSDLNFRGPGTIEGWILTSNEPTNLFSISDADGTNDYFRVAIGQNATSYLTNELITIHNYNSGSDIVGYTTSDRSELIDGNWHHISISFDGDNTNIYIDGVKKTTTVGSGSDRGLYGITLAGTDTIQLGGVLSNSVQSSFNGQIDDFRIYNYARTPAQVIEDMNAGHPAPGSPVGSPVMHLKFDEGYGDAANDSSPQGNNGDLLGACPGAGTCPDWINDGKYGKALSYTQNGYVNWGDLDLMDTTLTGDYTVSTWVKTISSTTNVRLMGKGLNLLAINFNYSSAGKVSYYISQLDANRLESNTSNLNNGEWRHIVFVHDDDQQKIYIDGKLDNSRTEASAPVANGSNFNIGYDGSGFGNYFIGDVDETKIYNFALTDTQIVQEYNQGKSVVWGATSTDSSGNADRSSERKYCVPGDSTSCSAPVDEWKLDEGQGTSAYDTSGGNNTGTLNGPDWKFLGECPDGKCLGFNGTSDYVSAGASPITGTSAFTMQAWLKVGSHSDYGLATYMGGAANTQSAWLGWTTTAQVGTSNSIGGGFYGTNYGSGITDNDWHLVTLTFSGGASGTARLYIDGIQKVTDTYTPNLASTAVYMGRANTGTQYWYNGLIDNYQIFNYELTPSQIAWNFNKGDPIGHWKLNECQGNTAYDSGTGGNNGTITIGGSGSNTSLGTCSSGAGTEAWNNGTTGKRNASLDFDGNDDYIDVGSTNDFYSSSQTQFTVSAWVKYTINDSDGRRVFTTMRASSASGLALGTTNGTLFGGFRNSSAGWVTVSAASTNNDGQWHHVTYIIDGSNAYIYVDGKLSNSASTVHSGNTFTSGAFPANVGTFNDGDSTTMWDGQLDEVKVFNYALTEAQLKTIFNEGAVRFGE